MSIRRQVREKWEKIAQVSGMNLEGSMRDEFARKLNTEAVAKCLGETDRVVDVGCGNGFATAKYAESAQFTLGVDYIERFISCAQALHADMVEAGKLAFAVGDIRDLSGVRSAEAPFDKVVCERTLINLASWAEQKQALDELLSLLCPGGDLLLSEVTIQGHESVDRVRAEFGLEPLEKYWSNVYINECHLVEYLAKDCDLRHTERFSLYSLMSKVINATLSLPDEPSFTAPINEIAYRLSSHFSLKEQLGHTVFFVFRKRT